MTTAATAIDQLTVGKDRIAGGMGEDRSARLERLSLPFDLLLLKEVGPSIKFY